MATPEDRLATYFDTTQPHGSFNDRQIDAIALLLVRCDHATEKSAARSPRTYIVFRMIGRLDLLPRILSEGFGDDWFPVTLRGLPSFLDPRLKAEILQTQQLILTKSLDLENGQHCNYGPEEQRPYDVHSYIGSGGFGQVRVVESRVTYKQYALKTIRRHKVFGTKSKEIMGIFNTEMKIMKRLQHIHIVRYVGSYTDSHDLGLLMSPVADCDLGTYLERVCEISKFRPTLRTFFGCLATALAYLHDEGIKHRDIKPQNILVHKANVLLADFGISRDFLDTTRGPTIATLRYCAPEVANYEERNASADVWSLGCVFLEIQSALQNRNLSWIKAYYEAHSSGSTHYYLNWKATDQLLNEWRTALDVTQAQPISWMEGMLAIRRQDRPTAAEVMDFITASDSRVGFMYSCDECCCSSSEYESLEDLANDTTPIPTSILESGHQQTMHTVTQPVGPSKLMTTSSPCVGAETKTPMKEVVDMTVPTVSRLILAETDTSGTGSLLLEFDMLEEELISQRPEYLPTKVEVDSSAQGEVTKEREDVIVDRQYEERPTSQTDPFSAHHIDPMFENHLVGFDIVHQGPKNSHLELVTQVLTNTPGNSDRAQKESIVSSNHKSMQSLHAHFPEDGGPGIDDLYTEPDGFSKPHFQFQNGNNFVSFDFFADGWVPNIIICCIKQILQIPPTSHIDRVFDRALAYQMTQEHFTAVRDVCRSSHTLALKTDEALLIFCWYLERLAIPIIPGPALSRWPSASEHPERSSVLKHCLSILDMGPSRCQLLMYLLIYMNNHAGHSIRNKSKTAIRELAAFYGPYICGKDYLDPHKKSILEFLISYSWEISTDLQKAHETVDVRENLVSEIAREKQWQIGTRVVRRKGRERLRKLKGEEIEGRQPKKQRTQREGQELSQKHNRNKSKEERRKESEEKEEGEKGEKAEGSEVPSQQRTKVTREEYLAKGYRKRQKAYERRQSMTGSFLDRIKYKLF